MRIKHSVDGMRSITETDGVMDNGQEYSHKLFAERLARRMYGRKGIVGAMRADCWSPNGEWVQFEVFIGARSEYGGIAGGNIWFAVHNEEIKGE